MRSGRKEKAIQSPQNAAESLVANCYSTPATFVFVCRSHKSSWTIQLHAEMTCPVWSRMASAGVSVPLGTLFQSCSKAWSLLFACLMGTPFLEVCYKVLRVGENGAVARILFLSIWVKEGCQSLGKLPSMWRRYQSEAICRWQEAKKAGKAPPIYLKATSVDALSVLSIEELKEHALDADEVKA